MKVLVVGPSDTRSRGGMAAVIQDIRNSKLLNDKFRIDIFPSYIEGNAVVRHGYSAIAYLKFLTICRNYDVIHIHAATWGSTLRKGFYLHAAKRHHKKVILHIHSGKFMEHYEAASQSVQKKIADIMRSADTVVALSDIWKQTFEKAFDLTNCVSVENGVDTESLAPANVPGVNPRNFVCLSRLCKLKGSYDLVPAVEKAKTLVPDIKLYIAGDGEDAQIKALVEEKNLQENIEVVGWVDFAGKMELLKQCATVVLPSYFEGLPMSILEGMACGKAIISTTVGSIPEVVKAENGILFEPGDVDALADAMVRCAQNPQLLQAMAACNIRAIAEHYSMEAMHQKLAELYELADKAK